MSFVVRMEAQNHSLASNSGIWLALRTAFSDARPTSLLEPHYCLQQFHLFIFGCAGSSLLHSRLFSSCGEWGLLPSCSAQASHVVASLVGNHRLQGVQALIALAHELRGCGSWALEHGLNSCSIHCSAACGWDLSRSVIKPMSPASAGRFFTTEPPGQSLELHRCLRFNDITKVCINHIFQFLYLIL